jgi:hypothetical protein
MLPNAARNRWTRYSSRPSLTVVSAGFNVLSIAYEFEMELGAFS